MFNILLLLRRINLRSDDKKGDQRNSKEALQNKGYSPDKAYVGLHLHLISLSKDFPRQNLFSNVYSISQAN